MIVCKWTEDYLYSVKAMRFIIRYAQNNNLVLKFNDIKLGFETRKQAELQFPTIRRADCFIRQIRKQIPLFEY